jgi:tetratricopeptide (TPR) repeat protein
MLILSHSLNQYKRQNMYTVQRQVLFVIVFFSFFISISAQQNLTTPQVSQKASVFQQVGLTDIVVNYHRPAVNKREVWGTLVPYDQVWRAGANENTTISFSTDVTVGNNKVAAGTYGLHMIPTKNLWTIILNKDNAAWGSFFYNQANDAVRFTVNPVKSDYQEWLSYSFDQLSANSTTVTLNWEKLSVPIKIEVDINKTVVDNMERQLTGLPGFFWQGWNQIATYNFTNNFELDKGLQRVDRSIGINKNLTNMMTKSLILQSLGKSDEAAKIKNEAFTLPGNDEAQINTLGYQLMGIGKTDEALKVFEKNTVDYPNSWNVWDSLAEGLLTTGDKVKSKKLYEKALSMAPDNQKDRIKGVLANIK